MMICGPAAGAAIGLGGLTPTGTAPRRAKFLYAALLATTALAPVLLARPAIAQEVNWDGSVSNDWNTAGNWDTNAVPTAADDVVIDDTTNNTTVIGAAVNAQANRLTVGNSGLPADDLLILGGGTLTTTIDPNPDVVGVAPASSGSIIVTGAGSQWNSGGGILLGIEGTGGLQVLNGGQVNSQGGGLFGFLPGSFGTATVSGSGSAWINGDTLMVGGLGDGLLTIENQGQVSNIEGYIGYEAGSTSKATVRDAGSSWTNTQELYVGYFGDGTLEVLNGADVTSTIGGLGAGPDASGSAIISGAGSTWTMTDIFFVGTGVLTIENGGQVATTGGSFVGFSSGGTGSATVTGAASSWTTNEFHAGGLGVGTVTVSNGATLTSTVGYIGAATAMVPTAQGSVTVTGTGSTWFNTGDLTVGNFGKGTLDITDQGQVNVAGSSAIGLETDSDGMVTVTGAGSSWNNAGSLAVGSFGEGLLTIGNQGLVSNTNGFIGSDFGSIGKATVTGVGSTWTNTQNLWVGFSGDGTLEILDGGTVTNVTGFLGFDPDSSGNATISGTGSIWTNTGDLLAGSGGDGTLNILDGGVVASATSILGDQADGLGSATVSGAGSLWTTTGLVAVGGEGTGSLTIEDGGQFTSGSATNVGNAATGTGDVTVDGAGSLLTTASWLAVGRFGTGTLAVNDGGVVQSTLGYVGLAGGSQGVATIADAGSTWSTTDDFIVGVDGTGSLNIVDQGLVDVTGDNFIGYDGSSQGSVSVRGAGSTWTSGGNLTIGRAGTGMLSIEDQATVNVGGNAFLGDFLLGNGTATVTGAGSLFSVGDDIVVGDQGEGALVILDGAKAISTDGVIGQIGTGTGTATVSGADALWEITDDYFAVGEAGMGMLTIADGGLVKMADNLGFTVIGASASGVGEVNVVDAGWTNGGVLVVGNAGTGTLTLDNAMLVNSGGVVGGGPGSSGAVTIANGSTWTNNGLLQVGSSGTGEVTLASGGIVDTGIAIIADNAGSLGTLNIGAAAGDAPAAPGTLATANMTFGAGVGTLVFNHTSQDYLFSPEIDGVGAIEALAGRTLLATAGTYSGSTTIHDGAALSIDGSIGGTLDVLSGGRLEGAGMAAFVTVAGTVAPGNSIGTFHVAGDYTQVAGSTYEVEIDAAGNSDLIDVTGMATLTGGTVEVVPFPDFALATPYTILTAAGGVTGTFDGASMAFSSLFLLPQLSYDANNAFFAIAQNASFDSAALTPNQKAAAQGADSLGVGNAVWDSIALLGTQEEAQAAFDAISGEVHASAGSVLIEDSRFVREAMNARLRASFATVGAGAVPVLAYDRGGPKVAPADTERFAAWGHAFGSWGEWDSDGNAASLHRGAGGFFLGGDMVAGEVWRLGLLAGYSNGSFDIDDRTSSGSAESFHLGTYAGTEIGGLGLRFGAAYSWHDVETARTVSFPGFTDTLSAGYDAATAQFFAEAGYRIDTARASFEPFANLAYVNLHTDGFTETGGAAALAAASSNHDATFTTLGLRAETALPLGDMTARLHGMLGWRHAFGDVPTADLSFAGGSAFTIAGVPIAEDAAVIEAGLDLALSPSANLGIAYNGQIGGGISDHGLKAQFSVRF